MRIWQLISRGESYVCRTLDIGLISDVTLRFARQVWFTRNHQNKDQKEKSSPFDFSQKLRQKRLIKRQAIKMLMRNICGFTFVFIFELLMFFRSNNHTNSVSFFNSFPIFGKVFFIDRIHRRHARRSARHSLQKLYVYSTFDDVGLRSRRTSRYKLQEHSVLLWQKAAVSDARTETFSRR